MSEGFWLVILQKRVAGLNASALSRFVLRARRAAGLRQVVNVLVTSSAAVRSLNRRFRGKDKATDVLSFPASPSQAKRERARFAGDIAISADVAMQNANRLRHSPGEEVKILALHGILHLAGFDHERDNGKMAREEARLRRELGLPASLIERTDPPADKSQRVVPRPRLSKSATRRRR
ncbi:MAG TPA: rRNA maturation RNase YbeY [Verrucomicrobiae bacterium]|nr:rRNA maturation RNase YbeY [Verrucomicrobiae bacterium]